MEPHGWRHRLLSESAVKLVVPLLAMAVMVPYANSIFPVPAAVRDAYSYTMTAQRLAEHGYLAFGAQAPADRIPANARVTPGWPLALASVFVASGVSDDPAQTARDARPLFDWLMYAVSLGIIAAITLSGRALGGPNLGLLAGLLGVAYLPFSWAGTVALAEHLGAMLFAWQIYFALRLCSSDSPRKLGHLVGFGVLVALTLMVRPNLLIWTFVPLAYIAVRKLEPPVRVVKIALAAALGFCLVFAPWWVRNARQLGVFVPFKSDVGAAAPQVTTATTAAVSSGGDIVWEQTSLLVDAQRAALPWHPFIETLYETMQDPNVQRIEFEQPREVSISFGDSVSYTMQWYHRFLAVASLLALFFIKRSPRLVLLFAAPLSVFAVHWSHLTIRYLYPTTSALVVLAAIGLFGSYRWARSTYRKRADEV